MNVLEEAESIVNGQRNEDYGDVTENFARTGKLWGAIIDRDPIPPRTVAHMMIALKMARDTHKHKRDNLVDIAGYALCAERCEKNE